MKSHGHVFEGACTFWAPAGEKDQAYNETCHPKSLRNRTNSPQLPSQQINKIVMVIEHCRLQKLLPYAQRSGVKKFADRRMAPACHVGPCGHPSENYPRVTCCNSRHSPRHLSTETISHTFIDGERVVDFATIFGVNSLTGVEGNFEIAWPSEPCVQHCRS